MFDTEKFIQFVQERPELWEKSNPLFTDKTRRDISWQEIGFLMYGDWNSLDDVTKTEKVKDLKSKWRNLKDRYFRVCAQPCRSGNGSEKKKKYVFADALSFLQSCVDKKETREYTGDAECNEQPYEEINVMDYLVETNVAITSDAESCETTSRRKRPISKLEHFQDLNRKYDKAEEFDADKMFLLSLLPDYKSLTSEEKLDFKFLTIQFFRGVKHKQKHDPSNPQNVPQISPPIIYAPLYLQPAIQLSQLPVPVKKTTNDGQAPSSQACSIKPESTTSLEN